MPTAMPEASYLKIRHHPPSGSTSSASAPSIGQDTAHAGMQQHLATMAVTLQQEPNSNTNKKLVSQAGERLVLDTSKHRHYRRRRSSVIEAEKASKQQQELQEKQVKQFLALCQKELEEEQQKAACSMEQKQILRQHQQQEAEEVQTLEHMKFQDSCMQPVEHLPVEQLQGATVIHKPQPLPLRPTARSSTASCLAPPCVILLFSREYASLLQWQKKDFQAFTEEIQGSLGGTLKKYIKDYYHSLHLLRQTYSTSGVSSGNGGRTIAQAMSTSQREDGEGSHIVKEDDQDQKKQPCDLCTEPCEKNEIWETQVLPEGYCLIYTAGGIAKSDMEALRVLELQQQRMDKAFEAFGKARDAVVSVREAARRIEEHRAWVMSELSLTRLELMNLRFYRCSPRTVLREAMDLAGVIRSFVMELSSAIDRHDFGVPWPFPRKVDCSDVTPLFIKQLAEPLAPPEEISSLFGKGGQ